MATLVRCRIDAKDEGRGGPASKNASSLLLGDKQKQPEMWVVQTKAGKPLQSWKGTKAYTILHTPYTDAHT